MVATSGLEASASALPQDCSIGLYAKADRTDGYAGYFNLTGASSNPGVFINSNSQKYGLHINQYNDAVGLFVHSNDSTSASIDSTSVYILNDGKGKTLHLRNPDTGSNSIFIHGQSHSTGHGINMQMLNSASAGTGILVEHGGTGSGVVSTLFNPTNTGIAIRGTQAGKNSVAVFETLPGNASTGSVDSPAVVIKQHNNGEGINLELMPTVLSPAGFRLSNHGSGIGIHLISDHPTSTAAGILVGQSSPGKGAVVLTLADISTENEEPTFQAVNMCKGSAADFRVDLPVNENPAVAITHAGIGRSLYLSATNAGYTGEVATIENAGSGKALSVETSNPGTTTLSIFEVGGPASPGKQRVAHFNQPIGGAAFYNEAVLISSSGSNPMVPVLKVTSGLSALGTAAEFDGSLDVTGGIDLTGDVSTFG
ncbi:MAG: hypothetical protein JNM00_05175, partial [Flavobacteriales bacterium]|nr:hypothetical protein [Flavobacteriales bacterium]